MGLQDGRARREEYGSEKGLGGGCGVQGQRTVWWHQQRRGVRTLYTQESPFRKRDRQFNESARRLSQWLFNSLLYD
jgi:hypothetical protein